LSGVKIWLQLVSSPTRIPNFLAALQSQCDEVAAPGTQVLVRGTDNGGFADQYEALFHLDGAEILRTAFTQAQDAERVDVYAMANCMDPSVAGLREVLDVPVVTLMEVGCFLATMTGDRFGVIAPNAKMIPQVRGVVEGYGWGPRMAGILPLPFDRIPEMDLLFVNDEAAEAGVHAVAKQAEELVRQGAEVILAPGPIACVLARRKVHELVGVPVIDMYSSLVKFAEAIGTLRELSGLRTSRIGKYQQPQRNQIEEALRIVWSSR
jgi:allantoin racemase